MKQLEWSEFPTRRNAALDKAMAARGLPFVEAGPSYSAPIVADQIYVVEPFGKNFDRYHAYRCREDFANPWDVPGSPFPSADAAKAGAQREYEVSWLPRLDPAPEPEGFDGDEPMVFKGPGWRADEFRNRVAKANRKLTRAMGAGAPQFKFDERVVEEVKRPKEPAKPFYVEYVYFTLASPFRLTIGDYEFVDRLVPEKAGMTVHTAPGQSLEGWTRPEADDDHCDHCGVNRRRIQLFVVREKASGNLLQLGSTCIQPYTGVEPKGLWALTFDEELRGLEEDDLGSEGGGGYGNVDYSVGIRHALAVAYILSDEGRGYVSKNKAYEWDRPSTVSLVKEHILYPPRPSQKGYKEYLAEAKKVSEVLENEALIDAIVASAESLRAGTDYADNMHILLAAESGRVTKRNLGVLASLVAVYAREEGRRAERKAKPQAAAGFLAPVKQRIRNFSFTLTTVRTFPTDWGTSTLLIGTTESGHTVKWFASGSLDYKPGDVVKMEAATVKEHVPAGSDKYTNADTTVLTRGVIDTFEERAKKCQAGIEENARKHAVQVAEGIDSGYSEDGETQVFSQWKDGGYQDVVIPEVERWFSGKAEIKRFREWQKVRL